MGFIGIKVAKADFNVAIVKTIRKYKDISISEIQKIVSEGPITCMKANLLTHKASR